MKTTTFKGERIMKEQKVILIETLQKEVENAIDDISDTINIAQEMYDNSKIIYEYSCAMKKAQKKTHCILDFFKKIFHYDKNSFVQLSYDNLFLTKNIEDYCKENILENDELD